MKNKLLLLIGFAVLIFIESFMPAKLYNYISTIPVDVYNETKIGKQIWMTENLNVVTFKNGDTILQAKTKVEWRKAISKNEPAWCYYDNDSNNGIVYGKLYNWSAVNDKRGLAPEGWHIPSAVEWHELYDFLGGKKGQTGKKLKSNTDWIKGGNGDNSSNFKALPAGVRDFGILNKNNGYKWKGSLTIFWSTNKPNNWADVECFVIRRTDNSVFEWHDVWSGYSVRCIKD